MATPKRRHTASRRDKRRMHYFIKPTSLVACKKCGEKIPSHTACPNCGTYKGKQVIDVFKKLDKKEKKEKAKELAMQEQQKQQG